MVDGDMTLTIKFDEYLKEKIITWVKDDFISKDKIRELPWKEIDGEAYVKIDDLLK